MEALGATRTALLPKYITTTIHVGSFPTAIFSTRLTDLFRPFPPGHRLTTSHPFYPFFMSSVSPLIGSYPSSTFDFTLLCCIIIGKILYY
jgi:hypothetical protein